MEPLFEWTPSTFGVGERGKHEAGLQFPTSWPPLGSNLASLPTFDFITGTWQLLSQRLQLRKLSCSSEWPLLLLRIFPFHHYYKEKSMHMISTMDFFFISCVKSQSVNGGAVGAACQTRYPTASSASSFFSSSTGGIWQLELICEELSLSLCWLRCSRQLYQG